MKSIKRFLGICILTLAFACTTVNAEEYYRLGEFKSGETDLNFPCELNGEQLTCDFSVSPRWEGSERIENTGELNLQSAYEGQSGTKPFSMQVKGNELDTEKNYTLSITSNSTNSTSTFDYTGSDLNAGVTVSIMPTIGNATLTLKESNTENLINYARFNCDGAIGECNSDLIVETYNTIIVTFTFQSSVPGPSNQYQEPAIDEEEVAKMETLIKKIAPNGKLKLDTVDPSKTGANKNLYDSLTTAAFVKQYDIGEYDAFVFPKSEYVETPYIELYYMNYEKNTQASYSQEVEIEYAKQDKSINNILKEIKTKLNHDIEYYSKDYNNNFNIVDLESLNYYYNTKNVKNQMAANYLMPSYSSKIHELTNNVGFDFMFDPRAGGGASLFYEPVIGPINVLYNGVVVDNIDPIGFTLTNILYIPSDTPKTREAFIEAAQKRIDEYFPGQNIKVEYEDKISELEECEYSWSVWNSETQSEDYTPLFDLNNTNGEFYTIQIGDATYLYFIVADSTKMNTPMVKSVDMNTNIKVETESYDVPLDTRLNVTKLDKNSEEFKELAKKVKILDDNSYNIDLLSTSLDMKIEKLSNGNFKVYIPINKEYAEKTLVAVYVKDDGSLEEHEIKIENGYAIFETDHFSTYSIAEKEEPEEEQKEDVEYTADLDNFKLQFTDEEGHEFTVSIFDVLSLSKEDLAKITTEEEYNKTMEELTENLKDEGKIISIYVIEVEDEKTEGTFKIKIKMTDEMKKYTSFKLVNINEENNTKGDVIKLTIEGDYLVGELPHLSVYALVGEETQQETTNEEIKNPKTGDNIMKYVIISSISLTGIVLIGLNKKKIKASK